MAMQESGSSLPPTGMGEEQRCQCGTGTCRSFRLVGLPGSPSDRKQLPIGTACLDYFPLALAEVAKVSLAGQKQHGTTGWDRSKSTDHADSLIRHFLERGSLDSGDGLRHSAKLAWRALALLQVECEASSGQTSHPPAQISTARKSSWLRRCTARVLSKLPWRGDTLP